MGNQPNALAYDPSYAEIQQQSIFLGNLSKFSKAPDWLNTHEPASIRKLGQITVQWGMNTVYIGISYIKSITVFSN